MPSRLVSLFGLIVFIGLAWALSNNRSKFPWRCVLWGVGLQFFFAWFILKTPIGEQLFGGAQVLCDQVNVYANEGAKMVFGPMADRDALTKTFGPGGGMVFAVTISATIIFISALSSLLYHWGVLQRIVAGMAWVMQKAMGVSGCEALAAASNIFLGQTEAALLIKPYLSKLTESEVMVLMTTGFSTIATGVMAVYAGMDGMKAGHIITASVLGAPAGILVSKVMWPETKTAETSGQKHHFKVEKTAMNSIDALCSGAGEGVTLSINVMGMLLAFVAVVALMNALFIWPQSALHVASPISIQQILGWINAPIAWLMGIPPKDCGVVGQMLGERIVLNEFIGYLDLSAYVKAHPGEIDERSVTLTSYALCGFANLSSIAIQIGGIGALVPERRHDLARLGFRAMIAGLIACYLFTAVVGVIL